MPQELEITLNGETCSLLTPVTLHEMIRNLGLDEDAVAIERNREIVQRPHWKSTVLQTGDTVEIVHFIGGG